MSTTIDGKLTEAAVDMAGYVDLREPIAKQESIRPSSARRTRAWAGLLPVLALQTVASLLLMGRNTAFLDEATYISAGKQLMQVWLHGGPNLHYETYFSGAPVVYPVLAGAVDMAGGLVAVRLLSLMFMLVATVLAYVCGRRIYGQRAGWFSAATFASLSPTIFLGAFATFDAMAVMLLSVAGTIVILAGSRATERRVPTYFYLAGPVLYVANLAKYSTLPFDLVIFAVALAIVARRSGWWVAARATGMVAGVTAALLSITAGLAGPAYWRGVFSTTLARTSGSATSSQILIATSKWIGLLILLSAIGLATVVFRARRGRRPAGDVLVATILFVALLVAPFSHLRISTMTSLAKHVGFGAWFGSLLAGYVLAELWSTHASGRRKIATSRLARATAALLLPLMLFTGFQQAQQLFGKWANSAPLVQVLGPLVASTTGPMLVDDAVVPEFYLGTSSHATRWIDTTYFKYRRPEDGQVVTGIAAFTAALSHGYFDVVALDWGSARTVDVAASKALHESHRYRYVSQVTLRASYGVITYHIWERSSQP